MRQFNRSRPNPAITDHIPGIITYTLNITISYMTTSHTTSYLYFLDLRLPKMSHISSRRLIHKRRIRSIRFRQPNLVRYIRINSLISCCLCCKRRIVLLHHLFLHTNTSLLLISLLVSHHLQILYLGLGGRR